MQVTSHVTQRPKAAKCKGSKEAKERMYHDEDSSVFTADRRQTTQKNTSYVRYEAFPGSTDAAATPESLVMVTREGQEGEKWANARD